MESMALLLVLAASRPVLDDLASACFHGRGTWVSALLALSLADPCQGEGARRRIERRNATSRSSCVDWFTGVVSTISPSALYG